MFYLVIHINVHAPTLTAEPMV